MSTELVPTGVNPLVLLQTAIEKGLDPDKLGKLMDLAERYEKNRAAEVFGRSLAEFQSRCPTVYKSRKADRFAFASYDDVMRQAGPVLAECGIAVSFTTPHTEGRYEIVVRLRVGSYFEDFPFSAPMPDVGKIAAFLKLSEPQAFGFVLSYYKRYAICAAGNIVVTDEDNDAVNDAMANVTAAQAANINDLIAEKRVNMEKFLEWAQAASVEDIPAANYAKVIDVLRRKAVAK